MNLRQDVLDEIATRFVDADVTQRHRNHTLALYTDVYGVNEDNPRAHLQTLFDLAIQNRARTLRPSEYRGLSYRFDPEIFERQSSRSGVFSHLLEYDDIGPKIADEFLRKVVHVFGVKSEWEADLCVPMDTHVVKALVKTGAIDLEGKRWEADLNKNYQRVVNVSPDASPRTRIGYSEVQKGFERAAAQYDLPKIVFDELWLEHSRFISNPLFQSKSVLANLVQPEFQL